MVHEEKIWRNENFSRFSLTPKLKPTTHQRTENQNCGVAVLLLLSSLECQHVAGKEKIEYTRRPRTSFTPFQRSVLLSAFEKNNLPARDVIQELAVKLNLDETVIKNWFKNQRMKWKKNVLKVKPASLPGTSKQPSSESEEEAPQSPVTSTSTISATSSDHIYDPPEPFESEFTRRDGASAFGSSFNTQSDDLQGQCVEDFSTYGTDKLVELYYLSGEDDPSSLDIYLPPGCLQ
ncbi:paired-like homeodomain transcription factor LEUTX [Cavia porcellus]|uniref:paired-like homeodomain transcription factor LEUTX n=1 Tax=Cavia porcellus TaxID=10141 RepID=UPI002FE13CE0